ncbi:MULTISPECIES: flagellar protein FlaG [unclassified Pseudomonas]|uniref:flagellar protein FlaG n=1 Tax=unclassified Pseudomonas TaxID=196821 RepID=UPI00129DA5E9|nr:MULTISPECIES: flagellar protein FlaG [unclassified Pseudomonas]MDH4656354.1 flagellar protein FlaG [Pseudomonas sp. BN606]MRK19554.1 flagellar protein FlaG [Pseudomonas sp. JG-B]
MDVISLNGLPASSARRLVVSESTKEPDGASRVAVLSNVVDAIGSHTAATRSVEQAVSTIESFTQSISRNLSFTLDDSSGRVVVKVTDAASGEVIRQIPSEEALQLAESLEEARSLLFKAEA